MSRAVAGLACRIRVPLNTIQPNRYDRLAVGFAPASAAAKEAAPP